MDRNHSLTLPLAEKTVRQLKVGDRLTLTGRVFTARDAVHKYLSEGGSPGCNLRNAVIYHCGPIICGHAPDYILNAAGPTTSMREEQYMPSLIERFRFRAIIGKGGMGNGTLSACQKYGCVYLQTVGGAAQLLGTAVKHIRGAYLEDKFGSPEAIWEFEVQDFPAVVTMDTHGNNLHLRIEQDSQNNFSQLIDA